MLIVTIPRVPSGTLTEGLGSACTRKCTKARINIKLFTMGTFGRSLRGLCDSVYKSRAAGQWRRVACLTPLALLAIHPWFGPDIWYHLARAKQMLAQATTLPAVPTVISGANVTNQYWLYQLALDRAYGIGGVTLVSLIFAAAWVAIGWIWLRLTRASLLFLAFLALAQMRLEYRPETWSFLFLSVMLLALSEPRGRWRTPVLLATQVAWVNVHGYFALGPCVVGAAWLFRRDRRHAGLLAGVALATLVNPGGWRAFESLWAMMRVLRELDGVIEELTPTTAYAWWAWPMPVFWMYFAGVGAAVILQARRRPFEAMVATSGLLLGLRSFRFVPIMLIMTAPVIGAALARVRRPRAADWAAVALSLGLAAAVVRGDVHRWLGSGTRFGLGLEWAEYPIGVAEFLRERGFAGRLFNDPDDGGYFEYHLPGVTVAADSSYVDADATREYFAAVFNPAAFARWDQRHHFDAAVLRVTNEAVVAALRQAPAWAPVYADSHRIVFLKNAAAIDLATASHRRAGEDLTRYGYAEAAAAWVRLAEREGDARLLARLREEFR